MALVSDTIYKNFLVTQYSEASAGLESAKTEVAKDSAPPNTSSAPPSDQSLMDMAYSTLKSSVEKVTKGYEELKAKEEEYRRIAENSMTYLINLVLVFIFETIVTPLLFLFALKGTENILLRRFAGNFDRN